MRSKKVAVHTLFYLSLGGLVVGGFSVPAFTKIDLVLECAEGEKIVGVWLETPNHRRWLDNGKPPNNTKQFEGVEINGTFELSVGCGGTPKVWLTDNKTAKQTVAGYQTIFDDTSYSFLCNSQTGRCT